MAKRKIYIDPKEFSAEEISRGKDFAKLLTEFNKIAIPFYAKTPFILSAVAATVAVTGGLIYMNYFAGNNIPEKQQPAIVNQLVDKSSETSNALENNNTESSSSETSSQKNIDASTADVTEKKQEETTAQFKNDVNQTTAVENSKSYSKNNKPINSSDGTVQERKNNNEQSAHFSKNKSEAAYQPVAKHEKIPQKSNNVTAETADKKNQAVKTKATQPEKNDQPVANLNSANDKQSQNSVAKEKQKTSDANDPQNSNTGSASTKQAVQNDAAGSSSEKSVVKEKESNPEIDKPATINNASKNIPDSALAPNPVHANAVPLKDSIKNNTDTTKYEMAKRADFERSFNKRKIVISGGMGLGVYGTLFTDATDGNVKKDGAASAIYFLSGEYGITKWIGAGAKFSFDNYFVKRDSSTGTIPSAHSFNYSGFVNFHFVRHKRFDFLAGISLGYSKFVIKWNDVNNTTATGNGTVLGIYVVPRFYFNDHFGMFANISLAGFTYSPLDLKSNTAQTPLSDKFIGNGLNISIGAQMKFK